MFTGIISAVSRVTGLLPLDVTANHCKRLTSETPPHCSQDVSLSDNIALNAACLTVPTLDTTASTFTIDASTVSLDQTTGVDHTGSTDVEKALRANDQLNRHLVSGHGDGMGMVQFFGPVGGRCTLHIAAPPGFRNDLAYKGSITVNGVSLAVNTVTNTPERCEISINLIPYTIENTSIGHLRAGSQVNRAVDVIAGSVERMLGDRPDPST